MKSIRSQANTQIYMIIDKVKTFTLAEQHPARLVFSGLGVPGRAHQRGFLTLQTAPYIAIAVLVITTILFFNLYRGAVNDYAEFRANVEAQQEQIRLDNERKVAALMDVNSRLESGWSRAVSELKSRPTLVRVRDNCSAGGVQAVPASASKSDDATTEQRPDPAIVLTVEQCEERVANAIVDAAQVRWLQQWVLDAHEATK